MQIAMNFSTYILSTFLVVTFSFGRLKSQTVYIAETGKKYHKKNCVYVQKKSKEIDIKKAIKEGYKPCPSCGADDIKPTEEKEKPKKDEGKEKTTFNKKLIFHPTYQCKHLICVNTLPDLIRKVPNH